MSEDCEELEAAARRAWEHAARLDAQLAETEAAARELDAQLDGLLRDVAGEGYGGSWEDYGLELQGKVDAAGADLSAAEEAAAGLEDPGPAADAAWAEHDRLVAEYEALESRWLAAMARITGDASGDMGVPSSSEMAHASDLRGELDQLSGAIDDALDEIERLENDWLTYDAARSAVATAETTYEGATETQRTWTDASGDLVAEYRALPLDVRAKALEGARATARDADSAADDRCREDAEYDEDEGWDDEDGGEDDDREDDDHEDDHEDGFDEDGYED